jgi:glycosyltransferase involved in cell wall biosynthesis
MSQKLTNTKISVIAFCFNEENKINDFITNLSFAQEIIFIDNNSTDKTTIIAKDLGATIIQQTTTNTTQQLNLAIKNTQNNWILLLDLNVKVSKELQDEILFTISNSKASNPYLIKQNLFFFGKKLKYGKLYDEKRFFLFDKKKSSFVEQFENKFDINLFENSIKLKNKIDYYITKSFDDYNHELSLSSKEKALIMYNSNFKPNFYDFLIKPFLYFIKQYFIKLGFLDGKEGYILAYINSFAILKSYLILWLLKNDME